MGGIMATAVAHRLVPFLHYAGADDLYVYEILSLSWLMQVQYLQGTMGIHLFFGVTRIQ